VELVVDANVLLASFLKEAITRELLLDTRLTFYAPEHLLTETSRHLVRSASLRKRIKLSNDELQTLFQILTSNIITVPKEAYNHLLEKAMGLAPHQQDAPYLAVALLCKIPIWSNDRGLKHQNEVEIYSTTELIGTLARNQSH